MVGPLVTPQFVQCLHCTGLLWILLFGQRCMCVASLAGSCGFRSRVDYVVSKFMTIWISGLVK